MLPEARCRRLLCAVLLCFASAAAAQSVPAVQPELQKARQLLSALSVDEPQPQRLRVEELRSNGEVRETLEIFPAEHDEDARYVLNGVEVDPATDSLGRFDRFMNQDDDEEDQSQEGNPRFETLRGQPTADYATVHGQRTTIWRVEFDTEGGDVYSGMLYLLPDGTPLRLTYEADTRVLISVSADSVFTPLPSQGIARRSLEIVFRIGASFLSRTYRMYIEY